MWREYKVVQQSHVFVLVRHSVLMKFGKRQNKNTSRLYTKTKWEFLSLKKTLFHTIHLVFIDR